MNGYVQFARSTHKIESLFAEQILQTEQNLIIINVDGSSKLNRIL